MQQYGVGIVGMGWVAGEHMRAWANHPQARVVGCVSRTREGAQRKIQEVGIPCHIYDSYEDLLADPAIQIISICSPNDLHAGQAIAAAQAGKHICLEKPIALAPEDLYRVRDAVQNAGVKSVVCFVLRWNPLFETVKAQLAGNAIGDIFYAEVDYYHGIGSNYAQFQWNIRKSVGGSSLLSAGCHAVDMLRWCVGEEAVEVWAVSTRGNGKPFDAYEYDPTEIALVRFANGAVGKITSCLESKMPYVFNLLLLGDKGSIRDNQVWAKETRYPGQTDFVTIPTIRPDSGDVSHHPFRGQINHFMDCILNDVESHCNIADAVKTHEIIFAADQSAAAQGERVQLPTK